MLMTCVAPQPHETIARFPGTIERTSKPAIRMPGVMVVIHFSFGSVMTSSSASVL